MLREEAAKWAAAHWDPDLTVRDWWALLADAGWSGVTLPAEWGGRGGTMQDRVAVLQAISECGALGPPGGMGLVLAAPTIVVHGTDELKRRYVPDILAGRAGWCQLFSEPGSGSDLAGLTTLAVRDGDEWIVHGQKVWSSDAQYADRAILLARTDLDAPKHHGITYFVLDMNQPGVEVRPLREMTGRAMFNEVFLTGARIPVEDVVGDVGEGWKVTNTTLGFERSSLGGGLSRNLLGPLPGVKAGALDQRVSEFVGRATEREQEGFGLAFDTLVRLATDRGYRLDPEVRQELAELHTLEVVGRLNAARGQALVRQGRELPGLGNMAKLHFARTRKRQGDLGLRLLGPAGTLHGYSAEARRSLESASPAMAAVTEAALYAQSSSILGGTDEIQRNILGERMLGLPREPAEPVDTPFRLIRKNA